MKSHYMHMLLSFQLLRCNLVKKEVTGFWLWRDRVHHGGDIMVAVRGKPWWQKQDAGRSHFHPHTGNPERIQGTG